MDRWVEVLFADGCWYRGRLVHVVAGTHRWRVQFDDGELREDVRMDNPLAPVRCVSAPVVSPIRPSPSRPPRSVPAQGAGGRFTGAMRAVDVPAPRARTGGGMFDVEPGGDRSHRVSLDSTRWLQASADPPRSSKRLAVDSSLVSSIAPAALTRTGVRCDARALFPSVDAAHRGLLWWDSAHEGTEFANGGGAMDLCDPPGRWVGIHAEGTTGAGAVSRDVCPGILSMVQDARDRLRVAGSAASILRASEGERAVRASHLSSVLPVAPRAVKVAAGPHLSPCSTVLYHHLESIYVQYKLNPDSFPI